MWGKEMLCMSMHYYYYMSYKGKYSKKQENHVKRFSYFIAPHKLGFKFMLQIPSLLRSLFSLIIIYNLSIWQ